MSNVPPRLSGDRAAPNPATPEFPVVVDYMPLPKSQRTFGTAYLLGPEMPHPVLTSAADLEDWCSKSGVVAEPTVLQFRRLKLDRRLAAVFTLAFLAHPDLR